MTYDLEFRFHRALQPESLTTISTCLHAVSEAARDAQNAGINPNDDPAVQLLSRHLGRLAGNPAKAVNADDLDLRQRCLAKIAELKDRPAIAALAVKGIDHLPLELKAYRGEGARTLRQIAAEIGFARTDYHLRYTTSNPSMAGEHELDAPSLHIRLNVERLGMPVLAYRNPKLTGKDGRMHHEHASALLDIPRLSRRIAHRLHLASHKPTLTLV